jgi:glucoamylase
MPLMWAHAEYMKLLRSVWDEAVFDRIPAVAERYLNGKGRKDLEVWKFNRQARSVAAGHNLRIQASSSFRLLWTLDEWATLKNGVALGTALGIHYLDIPVPRRQRAPVRFTFYWTDGNHWEGKDFAVEIGAPGK